MAFKFGLFLWSYRSLRMSFPVLRAMSLFRGPMSFILWDHLSHASAPEDEKVQPKRVGGSQKGDFRKGRFGRCSPYL